MPSVFLGISNRSARGMALIQVVFLLAVTKWLLQRGETKAIGSLAKRMVKSVSQASLRNLRAAQNTAGGDNDNIFVRLYRRMLKALKTLDQVQVLILSWGAWHLSSKASLLLGMNAPHTSLYHAPDVNYSQSFQTVRWLLTALDAGVLSCHKIRWKPLKNVMSVLCGIYYLFFVKKAEIKVQQFRKSLKVAHVREMWEKGGSPVIAAVNNVISNIQGNTIRMHGHVFHLPRKTGGRIECFLYYDRPREELKKAKKLILDFHGGGFVAMSPRHHQDYLAKWSRELGVPVVAVNYRKAPEDPYPCGFDDCYEVYMAIVKGKCSLLPNIDPREIVLVGDSAGGNLCVTVTLRVLQENGISPKGLHLIYPALDFGGSLWRDYDERLTLPAAKATASRDGSSSTWSESKTTVSEEFQGRLSSMSSRAKFAFDGVLPFQYQLLLGNSLLRRGGKPRSDMYISPCLLAPTELLAKFPPTKIHVGSVDPLVDDSRDFAARLTEARSSVELVLIPKVSHAYMQVINFLPEAQQAVKLSTKWLRELLDTERPLQTTLPNEGTVLTARL